MPSRGCLMLQIKEKLLLQEYNNCIYSQRDVKQEGGGHCLFTVTTSFLNFIHKIEQLDNLMVRIKDLIGGSQCIFAGCVQESVRKAEHGNGKSHKHPRKDAAAKADADNVLEERDPQYDVMLSQMVGRIRSKPGGKLEMGENKELYQKMFTDEEKRAKFLWWRVQFLERSIRKLDFNPGGTCTIFQVSDLKNSPGPEKRELRIANKQALQMLQDNYPEFVAKQECSH
ncbi:uncharacterized protein LOC115667850 isoform X2 [Syzygium oleosum]|uniref:uncharacterized protein LOC115667850 isoform X2 n=1 Tax=Syzygium oleosum TaxID=219896 RepID=UPI0024BA9982|nr:uncharacterized protein LOC115667850 isoform X2 [Syzygium oleosum]